MVLGSTVELLSTQLEDALQQSCTKSRSELTVDRTRESQQCVEEADRGLGEAVLADRRQQLDERVGTRDRVFGWGIEQHQARDEVGSDAECRERKGAEYDGGLHELAHVDRGTEAHQDLGWLAEYDLSQEAQCHLAVQHRARTRVLADVDEAQQEVEVVMECTMACQQLGLLSPFGREAKHVGNVVRGRGGG